MCTSRSGDVRPAARIAEIQGPVGILTVAHAEDSPGVARLGKEVRDHGERPDAAGHGADVDIAAPKVDLRAESRGGDLQAAQVRLVDRDAHRRMEIAWQPLRHRPGEHPVVIRLEADELHVGHRPAGLANRREGEDHAARARHARMAGDEAARPRRQVVREVEELRAACHHPEIATDVRDDARRHTAKSDIEPGLRQHQARGERHARERSEELSSLVEERTKGNSDHLADGLKKPAK